MDTPNSLSKPHSCGGCGGRKFTPEGKAWSCERCGGLVADHLYLGDSYGLVSPLMDADSSMDGTRYFDLSGVGSEGPFRRHGWFRPETGRVVQVG